jgi:hypothetical protein
MTNDHIWPTIRFETTIKVGHTYTRQQQFFNQKAMFFKDLTIQEILGIGKCLDIPGSRWSHQPFDEPESGFVVIQDENRQVFKSHDI